MTRLASSLRKRMVVLVTTAAGAGCTVTTVPTVEEVVIMAAIQDEVIDAEVGLDQVAEGVRVTTTIVLGGCAEPWTARIERNGGHVTVVPRVRLVLEEGVACPDVTSYEAYRVVIPSVDGLIERLTLQGYDLAEETIIEIDAQLPE